MSKKNKRKKQRVTTTFEPRKYLYTFAAVQMIKAALQAMEEAFDLVKTPLPNLEFGRQTLERLKHKINGILEGEDYEKDTPFDANEIYMLHAAVHLYLIDLTAANEQELIPMCLQLCEHFNVVVDSIPPEPPHDASDKES